MHTVNVEAIKVAFFSLNAQYRLILMTINKHFTIWSAALVLFHRNRHRDSKSENRTAGDRNSNAYHLNILGNGLPVAITFIPFNKPKASSRLGSKTDVKIILFPSFVKSSAR